MNIEFRKKHEIVTSVINNYGENPFTIGKLFGICESIAQKYDIPFEVKDLLCVLGDLYDGFEISKEVAPNGIVSFRKTDMYGVYEDKVSTR